MRRQPVLRHRGQFRQAGRHHPPTEKALEAAEHEQPGKRRREVPVEAALEQEHHERNGESEADDASEEAMRPFPPEDRLEVLDPHPGVLHALRDLLVGLEFGLPVGIAERRDGAGDRLPRSDGQPGFGQPRRATDHHHDQHQERHTIEPDADRLQRSARGVVGVTDCSVALRARDGFLSAPTYSRQRSLTMAAMPHRTARQ